MNVLVTGGAGYIGSHMTLALLDRGDDVVVLDNLSTGQRELVDRRATFVEGGIEDRAIVQKVIAEYKVDEVMNFAGSIIVADSVARPLAYYKNNVSGSRDLVETCVDSGIKRFIFSSTATVYSKDAKQPLAEESPKDPISPYATSKLMTEWMLRDVMHATDFRAMVLRYFNVAGADPQGRTGQPQTNSVHLIKRATMVALGELSYLDIAGTDYPTPDGTGVRDYIHVSDLADAHLLVLDALRRGAAPTSYNCGYGRGSSVRQVIAAVERVIGRSLPVREAPRRPGDPPVLIANPTKIRNELGWKPRFDNLEEIIRHALAWEQKLTHRAAEQQVDRRTGVI